MDADRVEDRVALEVAPCVAELVLEILFPLVGDCDALMEKSFVCEWDVVHDSSTERESEGDGLTLLEVAALGDPPEPVRDGVKESCCERDAEKDTVADGEAETKEEPEADMVATLDGVRPEMELVGLASHVADALVHVGDAERDGLSDGDFVTERSRDGDSLSDSASETDLLSERGCVKVRVQVALLLVDGVGEGVPTVADVVWDGAADMLRVMVAVGVSEALLESLLEEEPDTDAERRGLVSESEGDEDTSGVADDDMVAVISTLAEPFE